MQGPNINGNITVDNCALPGEMIRLKKIMSLSLPTKHSLLMVTIGVLVSVRRMLMVSGNSKTRQNGIPLIRQQATTHISKVTPRLPKVFSRTVNTIRLTTIWISLPTTS